jgi:hypothetical protein
MTELDQLTSALKSALRKVDARHELESAVNSSIAALQGIALSQAASVTFRMQAIDRLLGLVKFSLKHELRTSKAQSSRDRASANKWEARALSLEMAAREKNATLEIVKQKRRHSRLLKKAGIGGNSSGQTSVTTGN